MDKIDADDDKILYLSELEKLKSDREHLRIESSDDDDDEEEESDCEDINLVRSFGSTRTVLCWTVSLGQIELLSIRFGPNQILLM